MPLKDITTIAYMKVLECNNLKPITGSMEQTCLTEKTPFSPETGRNHVQNMEYPNRGNRLPVVSLRLNDH